MNLDATRNTVSRLPLRTSGARAGSRLWPKRGLVVAFTFLALYLCLWPSSARAQESGQEIVANLATGRVVICVTRDAMIIGAIEQRAEPGSHPPLVVPLSERRVAIVLGAAEWLTPASGQAPVRLDRELPRLLVPAALPRPQTEASQASDIETIGVAFLERVRAVATQLHRRIEVPPDEPLVELLLAGYAEGYGPEVWELRYRMVQDALRGEFWRTRVLRPSYNQLYPPEKGQPRTLIEVRYPPGDNSPTLLDLLVQGDPRLARIRSSDPKMARATEHLLRGESPKAVGADATAFLRAALGTVTEADTRSVLGVLHQEEGFEWILAPPELPEKAEEGKPREPGAPTLRKKPRPQ